MKGKYTQITIELIAWTAFLGFPFLLFPTFMPFMTLGKINPVFIGILCTHGLLICFYYFNFYFAIPRFYFTKKFRQYALVTLSSVVLITALIQTNSRFNPFPSPPFKFPEITFTLSILIRFVMIFLLSLGIANIIRLGQTEKEKLKTELSYLKSQIHPHFLFNTLNSIYALTVKKSDKAPESVTRLSSIMRYVITEAEHDYVLLEKEISYLSAYIALESLRLTSKVKLNYSVTGELHDKRIAPLIFIPLIENAFKHGISTSENSEITIQIRINGSNLDLHVNNNILRKENNNSNGLGLKNVRKRLGLLYPGKHELKISQTEKDFSVNLAMILND